MVFLISVTFVDFVGNVYPVFRKTAAPIMAMGICDRLFICLHGLFSTGAELLGVNMSKYWAENKQIQNRGFLIAKIISLGSFGILIYVAGQEQILDFIATLNVPTILLKNCTAGCNFLWTIGLFILFCIYWLVLLFVLIKPPKGFWVNFLLVFWGGVGFLFLFDAWDY